MWGVFTKSKWEISGAIAVREMVLRLPVLAHILQRISDFLKYLACIYFEIRSTPNLRNPNKTKTKNADEEEGRLRTGSSQKHYNSALNYKVIPSFGYYIFEDGEFCEGVRLSIVWFFRLWQLSGSLILIGSIWNVVKEWDCRLSDSVGSENCRVVWFL